MRHFTRIIRHFTFVLIGSFLVDPNAIDPLPE
jgi:hypothetical protein